MKSPAEIERAHDLMTVLLVNAMRSQMTPGPHLMDGPQIRKLAAFTSVLCWCLDHPHNMAFDQVLRDVERELRLRGLSYDAQSRTVLPVQ